MSDYIIQDTTLQDIADAIRSATNTSNTYYPNEMAAAIQTIEGGYPEPTGTVTITQNGTANVKDYATAAVNVPNSYAAADEGKVVSNGALVSQTARTVTENGTIDTTLNNSLTVNVGGGGEVIPDVPSAYQKIEYLIFGTSGATYITIPQLDAGSKISVKYYPTAGGEYPIIGHRLSDTSRYDFELYVNDRGTKPSLWARNNSTVGLVYNSYRMEMTDNNTYAPDDPMYYNEVTIGIAYPQNGNNRYIWIGHYYENLYYRGYCYYIKVDVNGALKYFFVPCYRKSDSVAGFYDTVNDVFYPNEGSGTFGVGPDV